MTAGTGQCPTKPSIPDAEGAKPSAQPVEREFEAIDPQALGTRSFPNQGGTQVTAAADSLFEFAVGKDAGQPLRGAASAILEKGSLLGVEVEQTRLRKLIEGSVKYFDELTQNMDMDRRILFINMALRSKSLQLGDELEVISGIASTRIGELLRNKYRLSIASGKTGIDHDTVIKAVLEHGSTEADMEDKNDIHAADHRGGRTKCAKEPEPRDMIEAVNRGLVTNVFAAQVETITKLAFERTAGRLPLADKTRTLSLGRVMAGYLEGRGLALAA